MENPYALYHCVACKEVSTAAIKTYRVTGTGRFPEDPDSISTIYHCAEHIDKAVRIAKWASGLDVVPQQVGLPCI
jgi:hypothetical protein